MLGTVGSRECVRSVFCGRWQPRWRAGVGDVPIRPTRHVVHLHGRSGRLWGLKRGPGGLGKTAPPALALPKAPIGGGRPLNDRKSESDPIFFHGTGGYRQRGIGQGKCSWSPPPQPPLVPFPRPRPPPKLSDVPVPANLSHPEIRAVRKGQGSILSTH